MPHSVYPMVGRQYKGDYQTSGNVRWWEMSRKKCYRGEWLRRYLGSYQERVTYTRKKSLFLFVSLCESSSHMCAKQALGSLTRYAHATYYIRRYVYTYILLTLLTLMQTEKWLGYQPPSHIPHVEAITWPGCNIAYCTPQDR